MPNKPKQNKSHTRNRKISASPSVLSFWQYFIDPGSYQLLFNPQVEELKLDLNMNKGMNDQIKQINFSILILESYIPQVKEYRNALSWNSLTMSRRIQAKKMSMNTLLAGAEFPRPFQG